MGTLTTENDVFAAVRAVGSAVPQYPTTLHPQRPLRRQAWVAYLMARSLVRGELAARILAPYYGITTALSDRFSSLERKQYARHLKQAVATGDLARLNDTQVTPRSLDRPVDSNRNTALHIATIFGHAEVVAWLLARGVRPDTRNVISYTPLHEAVVRGSFDLAQLLIEAGANANVRSVDGETPLSLACAGAISLDRDGRATPRPSCKLVELLIDSGARVDARGRDGLTPLHEAACPEQPEAIALLLERGADINARDAALQTPLHYAVASIAVRATHLLVASGADLWARDMVGLTPLERAQQLAPAPNEALDVGAAREALGDTRAHHREAIGQILQILQTYPTIRART
ncbi:MAG: ankyrin repeat domain-containing protein [Cyanobacteria bacterium J06639_1]